MRKSENYTSDTHSTCSSTNQHKRGLSRFSLRRLLYTSPLFTRRFRSSSKKAQVTKNAGMKDSCDYPLEVSWAPNIYRASASVDKGIIECSLCLAEISEEYFPRLSTCSHRSCYDCFQQYLGVEISESRIRITCPECSEPMHPNDIRTILGDETQFQKYEDFMVRRVLAVEPDCRWCPAPDCCYAVIASGCASCPKIRCERPGCNSFFCYHCKALWHSNQTCDAARAKRSPCVPSSSFLCSEDPPNNNIKACPNCQMFIVKMEDGSCNHMTCTVCGTEFCWLCMKEITDLHYLSPSGCTFWGKKPWSRKKKILWQLGTLVGAPVGIGLLAGIAIPAIIIGIPVWVGRKLYAKYKHHNKHTRTIYMSGGLLASVLVAPVLAGLAVGIGVPILLFYVYGVVPVSLCRSGGCGVSTSGSGVSFEFDDESDLAGVVNAKSAELDAVSQPGANTSIGEVSLQSIDSVSHRKSASTASLSSSIISTILPPGLRDVEVQADVAYSQRLSMCSETVSLADDGTASTRALAGSMLNYKVDGNSLYNCAGMVNTDIADSVSIRSDANMSLGSIEELASGLLRKVGRRKVLTVDEDGGSERVRFDDHISYIESERSHHKVTKKHSGNSSDSAISTSRPTNLTISSLRNQFLHSSESTQFVARPDVVTRSTTSKGDSSACLPVIAEPLSAEHVTIAIPEP